MAESAGRENPNLEVASSKRIRIKVSLTRGLFLSFFFQISLDRAAFPIVFEKRSFASVFAFFDALESLITFLRKFSTDFQKKRISSERTPHASVPAHSPGLFLLYPFVYSLQKSNIVTLSHIPVACSNQTWLSQFYLFLIVFQFLMCF